MKWQSRFSEWRKSHDSQRSLLGVMTLGVLLTWLPLSIHFSLSNLHDIDELCTLPDNATEEKVLSLSRSMGFTGERATFGAGLLTTNETKTRSQQNSIVVYKPFLPPLMIAICRLDFRNQELASTEKWLSVSSPEITAPVD